MLDEGSVPGKAQHKGRDEDIENEEEKLGEHIRLILRLDNTVDNLHFTY